MITHTTISSASIDWSKVPGKFKDDHADVVAMSEFYDQDKDIKEAVDSYLKQLNAELAKAKPAAAPLKVEKRIVLDHPGVSKKTRAMAKKAVEKVMEQRKPGSGINYNEKQSALLKEYNSIKAKYPDAIPLYLVGGFYETFGADAEVTSSVLGIVLTKRQIGNEMVSVAGFPEEKLDEYLPKLVKAGWKVALAQGQTVKQAKPAKEHANKHPDAKAKFSAKGAEGYLKSELTKAKRGDYRELSTAQVVAKARAFESARTKSGANRDEKGDSKKRLSPTPENLVRWMNNPGDFDIIGIDSYQKNDPTADLKIKTQAWWNRLGIKI